MKKQNLIIIVAVIILLAAGVGIVSAARTNYVTGLVFIDANQNGVWDAGEQGYGGELQWVDSEGVTRYVGTTVTVMTPAYDQFELTTAGMNASCTDQSLQVDENGNLIESAVRPCAGTFGMSFKRDDDLDLRLEVSITVPEGYKLTSPNPKVYVIGQDAAPVDFGVVPLNSKPAASPPAEQSAGSPAAPTVNEGASSESPYLVYTTGTNFVPGLVFVDDNRNGYWEPGEIGYRGVLYFDEKDWRYKYRGTQVTLISSSADKVVLLSAGHKVALGGDGDVCTQQGYKRPCDGTWGLTNAGDQTYFEIWLTVPAGYELTTPNPQVFITGTGMPVVDFGIAPVN
ncbi:MAG: hypothetical protein JXA42_08910 [Anaerolineales bacterium]|nr:hypothetical protein [Anaerolineales bacterium]